MRTVWFHGEWRVVSRSGAVGIVRVYREPCDCGCKLAPTWIELPSGAKYGVDRNGEGKVDDVRQKIGATVASVEIRGPGEQTTAEQIAEVVCRAEKAEHHLGDIVSLIGSVKEAEARREAALKATSLSCGAEQTDAALVAWQELNAKREDLREALILASGFPRRMMLADIAAVILAGPVNE